MLAASGVATVAAGNIGPPLIGVVTDPPAGLEVVVVEVSSFQLTWTTGFRPRVACWLNLSEDHLDWHRDIGEYAAAKERIWTNQQADDLAVANAEDPVVLAASRRARSRVTTFGLSRGDYREEGGRLVTPDGAVLLDSAALPRSLPHDRTQRACRCRRRSRRRRDARGLCARRFERASLSGTGSSSSARATA